MLKATDSNLIFLIYFCFRLESAVSITLSSQTSLVPCGWGGFSLSSGDFELYKAGWTTNADSSASADLFSIPITRTDWKVVGNSFPSSSMFGSTNIFRLCMWYADGLNSKADYNARMERAMVSSKKSKFIFYSG
jgi:hypothetical protein